MIFFSIITMILMYSYLFYKHREMAKYIPINKKRIKNLYLKLNQNPSKYTLYLLYFKLSMTVIFVLIMAYLLRVNLVNTILLVLISITFLPFVLIWNIDYQLNNFEFNNLYIYLTQFVLIFKTYNKVLATLQELAPIIEGRVSEVVDESLDKLEKGSDISDSLSHISDRYPHFIVHNLHSLTISVESYGSNDYFEALELIQDDIDSWSDDVNHFSISKKNLINKINFLILFAFLICYMALKMLFSVSLNTDTILYQQAIFTFCLIQIITFVSTQSILKESFIHRSETI